MTTGKVKALKISEVKNESREMVQSSKRFAR